MTRLLNPTSDELTYGGVRYAKDETGAFNVPENVAATVLQHPGGFYRAAPAAATAAPLPFNPVFNVAGGITLANDAAGRILALEVEHFGSLNLDGDFPIGDNAVTAFEARSLAAQYRQRLVASGPAPILFEAPTTPTA